MTGLVAGPLVKHEVEVVGKAERRRFTAAYKRRVVQEADRCRKPGEVGALLRREGLYSSSLAAWRAARARGELARGDAAPGAEAQAVPSEPEADPPDWNARCGGCGPGRNGRRPWWRSKKNSRPSCTRTTGRAPWRTDADGRGPGQHWDCAPARGPGSRSGAGGGR